MAKKQEQLRAQQRATNSEIDNLIEGVKLYQNAGLFYAKANKPLPANYMQGVADTVKTTFKKDLSFANDVYSMLENTPIADGVISLLKSAKDYKDKKRYWLMNLADYFLAYMQTS